MSLTRPEAFPARLALNAWDGRSGAVEGVVAASAYDFARRGSSLDCRRYLAPEEIAHESNWRHEGIGWGVILPDTKQLSATERAVATDVPELATLFEDRPNAAVFRYKKCLAPTHLERCLPDGSSVDINIASSMRGIGPQCLPGYLMIVAQPEDVPWSFQAALSVRASVGRLPLEGPPLANYVDHLVNGWRDSSVNRKDVVLWSVDLGEQDITRLLRRAITDRLSTKMKCDNDINLRYLDGGMNAIDGEAATFVAALEKQRPCLVVSTSHGATFTTGGEETLARNLGLPVDQRYRALQPRDLLDRWVPDGAIWYAHACCGAGSTALNVYRDLVEGDERVIELLDAVSHLGETVAPLPLALLSAKKPVRAFVGHVEPTFDWTVRDPDSGQLLTEALVNGLYNELFQVEQPRPLGLAMSGWYKAAGDFLALWDAANTRMQKSGNIEATLLSGLLAARDRMGQVILGDPTVLLPAPS